MLQKFNKYISDNNLVKPGDRILLAVSGGIDSMVMTHLFMKTGHETGIAHCNFSLRSGESDMDEKMVSDFAAGHKIQFFSIRFDTLAYARDNGLSVQMAARELRYNWFEKVRNENSFNSVAVAHNLNDNIETLLINLIRGTGIAGLTGIKPAAGNIIRPMLFATRQEISEYCDQHGIKYREDRSNEETKYIRNKIRHLIIPLLKEINPSIESTLNETAARFNGINEIVKVHMNMLREKLSEQKNDCITFNINLLTSYINNTTILYELFKPFGIADVTLNDLKNIIRGKTGRRLITGTHILLKNRKELVVSEKSEGLRLPRLIHSGADLESIGDIESVRSVKVTQRFSIPEDPGILSVDEDKLSFPMVLRRWNSGDYFFPLGMKHKKKLSDFFTDNKYSLIEKDNSMILESGGDIVCILGERIDNRFRITESTRRALIIKMQNKRETTGTA